MKINKIELFKKTDIFSKFSEEELEIISEYSENKKLSEKELLFNPGDPGNALFLIVKGEISILKQAENMREIQIANYRQNHCFGELDLLTGSKRNAIARAESGDNSALFSQSRYKF